MGFSTLLIWYLHAGSAFFSKAPEFLRITENYIGRMGIIGVDIFLFLSGFGLFYSMAGQMEKGGLSAQYCLSFYRRRFMRIFEVFLPVSIIIAFLDGWSFTEFLSNVSGWTAISSNVYVHLWYIWCILLFYLLFPLMFICLMKTQHKALSLGAVIAAEIVLMFACRGFVREDFYIILTRLPIFELGIYFAYLHRSGTFSPRLVWPAAMTAMLIGIVYTFLLLEKDLPVILHSQTALGNILVTPGLVMLLAWLFSKLNDENILLRILNFYGMISLEFYCWHEFIDIKVVELIQLEGAKGNLLADFVSIGLSTLLSWLTHLCVKKVRMLSEKKKVAV